MQESFNLQLRNHMLQGIGKSPCWRACKMSVFQPAALRNELSTLLQYAPKLHQQLCHILT